MQLLSVLLARSLWFVDLRDLNPRGRELRYTLFPALADKYQFDRFPYDTDDNQPTDETPGFKFSNGSFLDSQGIEVTINFTIFDDGLVAETRSSTRDCDAFIEDILQWMAKDFGIVYHPGMIRKKGYVSELNVTPAHSLGALNNKLEQLASRLASFVSTVEEPVRFEFAGLFYAPDPVQVLKPSPFRFERRLDVPFSTNRYFTQAPLHTDVHLQLLDELEQILEA